MIQARLMLHSFTLLHVCVTVCAASRQPSSAACDDRGGRRCNQSCGSCCRPAATHCLCEFVHQHLSQQRSDSIEVVDCVVLL